MYIPLGIVLYVSEFYSVLNTTVSVSIKRQRTSCPSTSQISPSTVSISCFPSQSVMSTFEMPQIQIGVYARAPHPCVRASSPSRPRAKSKDVVGHEEVPGVQKHRALQIVDDKPRSPCPGGRTRSPNVAGGAPYKSTQLDQRIGHGISMGEATAHWIQAVAV